MTSSEIAWRLLRHARTTDLAALSLSEAAEIMGAVSHALGLFFRHGPDRMRQTTASVVLPAPADKTNLAITAGAYEVDSGTPFSTSQRGCTIDIEGDTSLNEIVSDSGWLNAYQGSTGTKTATIYGDAVAIRSKAIERVVSDPWTLLSDSSTHPLVRARGDHDPANYHSGEWWGWRQEIAHGLPYYYAIQHAGISRDSDTRFILRVWPMPREEMILRFEADIHPDMLDHTNVAQVPVDLPVSDHQAETILLPLAERRMLSSTLWAEIEGKIAARIDADAQRAEHALNRLPKDPGAARRGRIRTKPGW